LNFLTTTLPVSRYPLIVDPEDIRKLVPPDSATGKRMSDRLEAIRLFRERAGDGIYSMRDRRPDL